MTDDEQRGIEPVRPGEPLRPSEWSSSAVDRARAVLADYERTLEIVEGSNNGS